MSSKTCHLTKTANAVRNTGHCAVCCVGGSLTVGDGAFTPSEMPWRPRFMKYLAEEVAPPHNCEVREIQAAIGAMKSYGSVFTYTRNVINKTPDLVFVEFCVNDATSPDRDLTRKSVEGIVRQTRNDPRRPDLVLLGAGARPGWANTEDGLVDHSIHRAIAEHYDVPFLDIQGYILRTLEERGETWDAVAADAKDDLHLNDFGNRLWFECMRNWFEQEMTLYDPDQDAPDVPVPPPLFSAEFENPRLVAPKPGVEGLVVDGSWVVKARPELPIPWHLESVLVGRPGDSLEYTFRGTAIGTICHVYDNGLKVQAWVDDEEVAGPYTNYREAFGNFDMLKHGMKNTQHRIRLTVGRPHRRKNNPDDCTARVGFFAVAPGSDGQARETQA